MIGDKTTTDIALGYEVRQYDNLTPEEKEVLPDRLKKPIDDFAASAKLAIKMLKDNSAAVKANLEQQKDDLRGKVNDDDFHEYLFGQGTYKGTGYIEQLRKIGVTAGTVLDDGALKTAVTTLNQELAKPTASTETVSPTVTPVHSSPLATAVVTAVKTYAYKAEIDKPALQVVVKVSGSAVKDVPLMTVFTDSANAYQEVTGAATTRKVYIKKGKSDFRTDETQYVQDDDGIFTRRYGVMHKDKDVISALLDGGTGIVKGKLQAVLGVTQRTGGPLAEDPEIYKVQKDEKGRLVKRPTGSDLTTREMLHIHQELGSGDSGRGLCLTSISLSEREAQAGGWESKLKTIHANDGIPFKSAKTVLVLVDLSKVPTGHKLLYNLYRPDAQSRAPKVAMRKGPQVFRSNQHMLDSVSKNRELFLRVLLRGYIANWADVERTLKPPTPTTPIVTGAAVGVI
jgi:hypothetical protein